MKVFDYDVNDLKRSLDLPPKPTTITPALVKNIREVLDNLTEDDYETKDKIRNFVMTVYLPFMNEMVDFVDEQMKYYYALTFGPNNLPPQFRGDPKLTETTVIPNFVKDYRPKQINSYVTQVKLLKIIIDDVDSIMLEGITAEDCPDLTEIDYPRSLDLDTALDVLANMKRELDVCANHFLAICIKSHSAHKTTKKNQKKKRRGK